MLIFFAVWKSRHILVAGQTLNNHELTRGLRFWYGLIRSCSANYVQQCFCPDILFSLPLTVTRYFYLYDFVKLIIFTTELSFLISNKWVFPDVLRSTVLWKSNAMCFYTAYIWFSVAFLANANFSLWNFNVFDVWDEVYIYLFFVD